MYAPPPRSPPDHRHGESTPTAADLAPPISPPKTRPQAQTQAPTRAFLQTCRALGLVPPRSSTQKARRRPHAEAGTGATDGRKKARKFQVDDHAHGHGDSQDPIGGFSGRTATPQAWANAFHSPDALVMVRFRCAVGPAVRPPSPQATARASGTTISTDSYGTITSPSSVRSINPSSSIRPTSVWTFE